jgi:peptide/nickel transport system ATP-binding protein
MTPVLSVRDLRVSFPAATVVDGVSFDVMPGEIVGVVGESGSGKSMTAKSVLRLLPKTAKLTGSVRFRGDEVLAMSPAEIRAMRGALVSMVFQDPMTSFNPVLRIGDQIAEAMTLHAKVPRKTLRERVKALLESVGIANAAQRARAYPHEFSGGMRQRALTAMAVANGPALLIADEPTTALDVTVQAQILELMKVLKTEFYSAIILITHDLGVVAETCDSVVVMYGGQCCEQGSVQDIFYRPEMPYTWGLLGSMPRMDRTRQTRLTPIPGQPPSLIQVPQGCVFHPRCNFRDRVPGNRCVTEHPDLRDVGTGGHSARCHIPPEERRRIFADEILTTL